MEILDCIFKAFSIGGIIILYWYTKETAKLRKNSDKQLATSVRPILYIKNVLDYLKTHDTMIDIKDYELYCNENFAFNVKVYIKGEKKIVRELKFPLKIISGQEKIRLHKDDFFDKENKYFTLQLNKLIGKRNWQYFLGYEDINQNRLYTLVYRDKFSDKSKLETNYLNVLKNKH